MLYRLARPALFALDPETVHGLTIRALSAMPRLQAPPSGALATSVAGLTFPNPIGLAAGFDKNAHAAHALFGLGFGAVEVGTITPRAQAGNPRPRLFRLAEDHAVINRMGFNNDGGDTVHARIADLRKRGGMPGPLGINIGANKDSADRIADYAAMARRMAPLADYLTVNVSSPNTPGLRDLQGEGALGQLLDAVLEARGDEGPPVFLKVAPDLDTGAIEAITRTAIDRRLGALIVANTTVARPRLFSSLASETGGLSGRPLRNPALAALRAFAKATTGAIPLIGVGGIESAADAWARIRAGASLVQLYSALVYEGPGLARRMARELEMLMAREGFTSIAEAVGTE